MAAAARADTIGALDLGWGAQPSFRLAVTSSCTWRAVARDGRNAPVTVALDNQGNVTQTR